MNSIVPAANYTFDASEKTITLSSPYNSMTEEQIVTIRNITKNQLIYDSANTNRGQISITNGVITFTYNGQMANSDKIQIEVKIMTLEDATLANISFSTIKIKVKHGTAAEWAAANPTLAVGEPGYETDTGILKIGDGVTAYNSLDYIGTESFAGSELDTLLTTVSGSNLSADHKITRSATLVIAASDSSAKSKAQADFVCDGVADNVELQAALDSLPDIGGEILLMEGQFKLDATVARAIDNVTWSGCGYSSFIRNNDVTPIIDIGVQKNWVFSDLRVDRGYFTIANGEWIFKNIWVKNQLGKYIHIDNWSKSNIAPYSDGGEYLTTVHNHPLMQKFADFENEDWSIDSGELTYDINITKTGSKSAKIVTASGIASNITVDGIFPDLTDCALGVWVYTPDHTKIKNYTIHIASGENWTNYLSTSARTHVFTISSDWVFFAFNTISTTAGNPDITNLTSLKITVTPQSGQSAEVYIGGLYFWKKALCNGAKISFTFDDGSVTIPKNAKPILDKYGYKGTQALIAATASDAVIDAAKILQEAGWDVCNHDLSHTSSQMVFDDPYTQYIFVQKWLHDGGFIPGHRYVQLYGGAYDAGTLRELKKYVKFIRSSVSGYNAPPGLQQMLMSRPVEKTTSASTVKTWIDTAISTKAWLILMFHDIVETETTTYDWSITKLTDVVDYCNTKNVDVVTYSEMIDYIDSTSQSLTLTGSGTISSGSTSVNIRHGFHKEPTSIQITPTSSLGSASSMWVSSKDTGTGNLFTVSTNVDPGQDVTFDWQATLRG